MTLQHKIKIASILFVLISVVCFAQVVPSSLPPPMTPPPPGAPIDGGAILGAFVALCYGAKKLIKK